MKNTKTKLISSVAVLLICFAMLIGSTFAWFTDSASTGVNKIQAGKLDIELKMQSFDEYGEPVVDADNNTVWVDAEDETLNWLAKDGREQEEIFWEPGATYELPLLKITNLGNLETQFQVQINGVTGTDKNGNPSTKLLDALDFEITYFPDEDFIDGITAEQLAAITSSFRGSSLNNLPYTIVRPSYFIETGLTGIRLRKNGSGADTYYVRIRAHMDESANNDYQGLSLENIGITVLATQCPAENDSFDDQYDKDALYEGQLFKTSFSSEADAVKFCADCYNNPGSDHSTHNEYLVINNGVAEVERNGAWMNFGDLDWLKDYILSYDVDLSSLANGSFVAFDSGEQTSWQDLQIGFKNDDGTIKVYKTLFTNLVSDSNCLGNLNGENAHLVYRYSMTDNGENVSPRYVINMNLEVSDGTNTYSVAKSTTKDTISPNTKLCWNVYTADGSSEPYATLDNFLFECN